MACSLTAGTSRRRLVKSAGVARILLGGNSDQPVFERRAERIYNPVMLIVRPKVAELVFQLYGRALHPELFEVQTSRLVTRDNYEATLQITSAGHVVKWRHQGITLTEVATSAHHPLPERRRLFSYPLKGERNDRVQCRGAISYQTTFQLERVSPEVFWTYQQELTLDVAQEGILYRFDSSGRMALGAMSFMHVEARSRSLIVRAFHTFPDDYAVVKCQSRFSLP
jgi:hypothetical protein